MLANANKTALRSRKISARKYGELLQEALPRLIRDEAEYDRAVAIVTELVLKGVENLSPEEDELLELLTALVERYDDEHYSIPPSPPYKIIRHLMEERGLKAKDLIPAFGSRGAVTDVINGKRLPSRTEAKSLAKFFNLPLEFFISTE